VVLLNMNFFVEPLRTFYFQGPYLGGWGGWEGMAAVDICAQLTHVSSQLWQDSIHNCMLLLENKFQAFLISCYAFTYMFLAIKIFNYVWFRFMIFNPIIKELRWFQQQQLEKKDTPKF